MENIDWKRLRFVPKPNTWFLKSYHVEFLGEYANTIRDEDKVESNCGFFKGMTLEWPGQDEPLKEPRLDEESCPFEEFDIFFRRERVNEWTYGELKRRLAMHRCVPSGSEGLLNMDGLESYGPAFIECIEMPDGKLWITNDEYDSQVNFCPVCGYEAKTRTN